MITSPMPISSAIAAARTRITTVLDLELDPVDSVAAVVVAVVGVVWVVAVSPAPVSSLSAGLAPRPADIAAGASAPASVSATSAHRQSALPLWRHACEPHPDTRRAYRLAPARNNIQPPARGPGGAPAHTIEWRPMAPKQRQVRIEQRGGLEAIQALEQRTDEELEGETKYKSAAMSILGARAAERFDAEAARGYFQRAIAAARPQERMQIRRMADASLALAERRAGDLKDAVERLGQTPPSRRQMLALRAMGLLVPPSSAGIIARLRGVLLIMVLIVVLIAIGLGIVELVSLPFGGLGLAPGILLGLFVAIAALAVIAAVGRHRRKRAARAAER